MKENKSEEEYKKVLDYVKNLDVDELGYLVLCSSLRYAQESGRNEFSIRNRDWVLCSSILSSEKYSNIEKYVENHKSEIKGMFGEALGLKDE